MPFVKTDIEEMIASILAKDEALLARWENSRSEYKLLGGISRLRAQGLSAEELAESIKKRQAFVEVLQGAVNNPAIKTIQGMVTDFLAKQKKEESAEPTAVNDEQPKVE